MTDPLRSEARLELCRRNIDYLADVAGLPPLPPHAHTFARIIRSAQAKGEDTLILASVGSLKSTVMNMLAIQDMLTKDPHVMFASRSHDVVKATTTELRRIIKTLFGTQGELWEAHQFKVPGVKPSKFPSCYGATTGTSIEGMRGDKAYPDDPIDDKSVGSQAYRNESEQWWGQKFYPRLNKGATVSTVGSPWYVEDLYMQIIKNGTQTHCFPAMRHPCPKLYGQYDNVIWHGAEYDLLWPEHLTRAFLEGRRQKIGSSNFAQRYLCDPTALLGGLFKPGWFKYFGHLSDIPPLSDMIIEFGIDMADSVSDTADLTAITVMGWHEPTHKIYILDCIAGRWEGYEFERNILVPLAEKWGPERITIEKTGQLGRINYLMNNTTLPIVPQDAIRSKADRFRTMEAPIEGGRIEFLDIPNVRDMVHEGLMFDPEVDRGHDDRFDSFEIVVRHRLQTFNRPDYTPGYGERDW